MFVLFEYTVDHFTNKRRSMYDQVMNLKSMVCLLAKQRTTFMWKDIISVFLVLQGSVETLTRWGGKIYHLPIACFLPKHFYQKLLKSNNACSSYREKCRGCFLLRHCVIYAVYIKINTKKLRTVKWTQCDKTHPENCKNCSSKCAYHCAQLSNTTQHGAVLINFALNLQVSSQSKYI